MILADSDTHSGTAPQQLRAGRESTDDKLSQAYVIICGRWECAGGENMWAMKICGRWEYVGDESVYESHFFTDPYTLWLPKVPILGLKYTAVYIICSKLIYYTHFFQKGVYDNLI